MEWIFVDGMSSDNTKQLIEQYIEKYPTLIKVYDNPNKTVPYAMNIGIGNAKGKYIIRLDAHADYSKNYISSFPAVPSQRTHNLHHLQHPKASLHLYNEY